MDLRSLHRASAAFIAVFACIHIANHLVSLSGIAAHTAFLEVARKLYRHDLVETCLLLLVAFQLVSGLRFVVLGWKRRQGAVAWVQAISGMYLAFFLLVHVGAVLFGRAVLDLDTNFHFAAAGFHVPPYQFFFAPYYFLAVLALFAHLGCAIHWRLRARLRAAPRHAVLFSALLGSLVSVLITLSLAGQIQPVDIPSNYKATYAPQNR